MADDILKDPLGRTFVLHDHTWYGHIVRGHPEMKHHRKLICDAVRNPVAIHISDADTDCRLFLGAGPRAAIMILVAADVPGGFVKTAHFVRSVKGVCEWSRQTPSRGS